MSQRLAIYRFKWIKETSQFYDNFIKNYEENSDIGYFLKSMLNILKNYMTFTMIYHFCQKE